MDLKSRKELASRMLKVGKSRVWFDPQHLEDISKAITAEDIRDLVRKGIIKALPKKGNSRGRIRKVMEQKRKGRRKGHGSRKGKKGTRVPKKESWMRKIRAQRRFLKEVKEKLGRETYWDLYRKSSGGFFRSVSHMKLYIEKNNLMRGEQ